MILIGQYDSSFVRRVGIALTLYGSPSSIGRGRCSAMPKDPAIQSADAGADAGARRWRGAGRERQHPRSSRQPGAGRAAALPGRRAGAAPGAEDCLARRRARRERASASSTRSGCTARLRSCWSSGAAGRYSGTLAALEADRAARPGDYWFGARFGHADIAVAASLRHAAESHPGLIGLGEFPALAGAFGENGSHAGLQVDQPALHRARLTAGRRHCPVRASHGSTAGRRRYDRNREADRADEPGRRAWPRISSGTN